MEEKSMKTAGKKEFCVEIRKITKEVLGKSWDIKTADFAYDVVLEAIKRSFYDNGRIVLEGLTSMEIVWREDSKKYNALENDGTYMDIPAHNILRIVPSPSLKKHIKHMNVKFIEDNKIRRGVKQGIDPRKKDE